MSDAPNIVDFKPKEGTRYLLFYKRPKGTDVPVGQRFRCVCGTEDVMTGKDQHCRVCGSRLQHQENADASRSYHTTVIVYHFNPGQRPRR